jgi:DNA repair protein RecN (Recombination protein N)
MLKLLRVKNFAVIKEQEVEFKKGLNVITGETGSGKSVLLQALSLILGNRPKAKYTRKGAEFWEIEALLDLEEVSTDIYDNLPEIAKNNSKELILYRAGGESKNKVMINGKIGNVSLLEEIAQKIINICGQGEYVGLLESKKHILLLDEFAGLSELKNQYYELYQKWRNTKIQLEKIANEKEQLALRRAELEFIIEELSAQDLYSGIRTKLEEKVTLHSNSEHIIKSLNEASSILESEDSPSYRIGQVAQILTKLSAKDSNLNNLIDTTRSIVSEIQSLELDINNYLKSISLDEEELEKLREQLANIAKLERKYKLTDEGLVKLLATSKLQYASIDNSLDQELLEKQFLELGVELDKKAQNLRKLRIKSAKLLEQSVKTELAELNMPDADLKVVFKEIDFSETGIDSVEFSVATNLGQDPQPLRLIASGGELARILLVLKKLLRDKTGVNVLVFDEVDSGVSGKVARAVGEKLKGLSKHSQVLCITHLAQVASLADHHVTVRKMTANKLKEGGVETEVVSLNGQQRIDEIAMLLSGHTITNTARETAKELLGLNLRK